MYAVVVTEPGGPEVLSWEEVPDPACGPDDVLIDVAASAVNRADVLQRQGRYPPPDDAPPWPGLECSGVVASVGSAVTSWSVGDEVCALLSGGGNATKVVVASSQVLPVPSGVDVVTAAALPEVTCTVWWYLVMVAGLRAGETVLIHGGASGVGTAAIQIATALGARVAVTAGSATKLERCARLGASILVNHRTDDFVADVLAATDGRGADVVLDIIGGPYLARNVDVLALDGRVVVIGLQGGRRGELNLGRLMAKRGSVYAATLRSRSLELKAEVVAAVRESVWPMVADGRVLPVIDRAVPMSDVAAAHAAMEAGDHIGKILLVPPRS